MMVKLRIGPPPSFPSQCFGKVMYRTMHFSEGAAVLQSNPTQRPYKTLDDAYRFFSERLFAGKLPGCLITMQRAAKAYGYFAGGRFGSVDGKEVTDEVALNPSHFRSRTTEESLSTRVHEMAHLQQHHFGKPGRTQQGMGADDAGRRTHPVGYRCARRLRGRPESQPLHRGRRCVRAELVGSGFDPL